VVIKYNFYVSSVYSLLLELVMRKMKVRLPTQWAAVLFVWNI
jgi:hypothetical protein